MQVVSLSDIGLVRKRNEDNLLVRESPRLFVVCDGMGGHKGGNIASNLAIQAIEALIMVKDLIDLDELNQAIIKANQTIYRKGQENPEWHEMGTTLTAALINNDIIDIYHVGDSRAYLLRNNKIIQITKDHTLAEEMLSKGMIEYDEKKSYSHILTRALGISEEIEIDNYSLSLEPSDIILLCSDGLSDMLNPQELLAISSMELELETRANNLLAAALEKGGTDNISLILVQIGGR